MARGETHPSAGVLLMTKEAQESGDVIRALVVVELYISLTTLLDAQQGYGVHSPRKAWQLHTQTLQSSLQRYECYLYAFSDTKHGARQKFYAVPKLRNQSSRRILRLFISLLYHFMSGQIENGPSRWISQLCKYHSQRTNIHVATCDNQADTCISCPFCHYGDAGSTVQRHC